MRLQKSNMTDIEEELDILPSELSYEQDKGKIILIKHDYYSSDSDYGRALLKELLSSLSCDADMIRCVILVDSSVKLLDSEDPQILDFFTMLFSSDAKIYISGNSLSVYNVVHVPEDRLIATDGEIADLIICKRPDLIIE